MRRGTAQGIFAIALLLSRLVLADMMPMPAAHAAPGGGAAATESTAVPCPMHLRRALTAGGCCGKFAHCACLHEAALMIGSQGPVLVRAGTVLKLVYEIQRPSVPAVRLFRPPILQDLPAC